MALFEKKIIIKSEIDYNKLADVISKTKSIDIDYDKLAKSIVNAFKNFEEEKEAEEEEKRKNALKDLRKKYKIKDEISGKGISVFLQKIANNFNYIRAFLGYDEKQAAYPVMTFDLKRAISEMFFISIESAFIIFGYIVIFKAYFYDNIFFRAEYAFIGLVIVFCASLFRIPRLEVSNMKNKEMLSTIFSDIMAFLAMIFALISLFKEKC